MAPHTSNHRIMVIDVGLDLVSVDTVAQTLDGPLRDRYLARIFTEREVADCQAAAGLDPGRLAARFAAKEATIKVLSASELGLSMRDIEVRRDASGRVRLTLHGRAAEVAADAGVVALSLSLTHEAGFAAAFVVADSGASRT